MDPIEGAFFPAYVPAFFHNAAIIHQWPLPTRNGPAAGLSHTVPLHCVGRRQWRGGYPLIGVFRHIHGHHCPKSRLVVALHLCGSSALPSSFSGHVTVHVSCQVCGSPHASDPMFGPTAYHRGLGFERSREPDTWSPKLVRLPLPCGIVVRDIQRLGHSIESKSALFCGSPRGPPCSRRSCGAGCHHL